MTTARHNALVEARFILPAAAALLFAVQIALTYPGELNADSTEQLRQASTHQFGDWHPPVMALVWSWLIEITGKPGSLLVLQQALHWLGFSLIADGCSRAGMPRRAWLVLAAGAFPVFLFYDRIVVKDVEMGAAYVAAFGLCFWFLLLRRSIPVWAVAASAVLLLYGTLTRTNAVFAVGPLCCLFFARGRRFTLPALVAFAALVAVVCVPMSNFVNHRLIGAKPQDSLQSLQIYDLVGIAVRSGDVRVLGPDEPALTQIKACYTSYWWDPFSPWGSCASLRPAMHFGSDTDLATDTVDPARVAGRGALWRHAILEHPLDYAAHRLSFFDSSLYFLVPALHFRFAKSATTQRETGPNVSSHDIRMDYLKKNVFFWPVFWLAVGGCGLAFLKVSPAAPIDVPAARLLILSGLLYSGAYLLIGVATDVRYYYWPIMSILLGVILGFPAMRLSWQNHPLGAKLAMTFLIAILLSGYAARIFGVHFV